MKFCTGIYVVEQKQAINAERQVIQKKVVYQKYLECDHSDKIFKFLSWLFGHVERTARLER